MTDTQHFLYKLVPPRPTFATTMTAQEAATMQEHGAYWSGLLERGVAVVFGPVVGPDEVWGLAVVEARDADEVHRISLADPAVSSGLATAQVFPMPSTIVRPLPA